MALKQTRRSTTLSKVVYDAARARSAETGEPLAAMIDRLVRRELGMPEREPRPTEKPPDVEHIRAMRLAIGAGKAERDAREAVYREAIRRGPRLKPEVPVDEGTLSILEDIVVRERELYGRTVTEGEVLDEAITRCLDAMGWPR